MNFPFRALPLAGLCLHLAQAPTVKLQNEPIFGQAAWYGGQFHGRPTASGEVFNMHRFTAASRDLPLGSFVRVVNLSNRRSVVVRINDRGPWNEPRRIIDLSYAASQQLDMVAEGVTQVRLESVPTL
jgi:rare lipoprotein A